MLQITIIHPQIDPAIIKYIEPDDIRDWLSSKYEDVSTMPSLRTALSSLFHRSQDLYLPVSDTPDPSGAKASLILKKDFLSNCMITIEEIDCAQQ
jgi:hypothetical protein